MEETDRERAARLEIEQRTSQQVADIMEKFEAKIDARFDKIENLMRERATEDQVAARMARCLEEGDYVRRSELYPIWVQYYQQFSEENKSRVKKNLELAKGFAWLGGGILLVSALIEKLKSLFETGAHP